MPLGIGIDPTLDLMMLLWNLVLTISASLVISHTQLKANRSTPPRREHRLEERSSGGNCIKIGLPAKSILRDFFQENRSLGRPFLLLRISFLGRPICLYNQSLGPCRCGGPSGRPWWSGWRPPGRWACPAWVVVRWRREISRQWAAQFIHNIQRVTLS